ncbi:MAG: U32 family peptidase [Phycisphaerae bacterium]|nr:U32 family peptidase [Phycisphaerae bacterium]
MAPNGTARVELLAPAGNTESLRAAVANGADAVYFGLEDFNARRRAKNFTLADLPETMSFLHRRNVRGYVTFNTLIFSEELERAAAFIAGIAEAGTDAVIVQDIGIIRLIRRMCPSLAIHASTQATQTHAAGIEFLRAMGVNRVILARELSVEDIGQIHRETQVELEVFVHGALCISFSGQCLASKSLFGRSANRGVCAQACRLPYQLVVDGQLTDPAEPAYVLSPKDLCACDHIPRLIEAGAIAFKIEGRLKSAPYVAAATRLYRQAIDAAVQGIPFVPGEQQMTDLAQSFSRGFTPGFLDGNRHRELVDGRSPKNRGLVVGTVVGRTPRAVLVEYDASASATEERLKPGDGVVFDDGHPERDEQGGRVYAVQPVQARKGTTRGTHITAGARRVEISFSRDDVNTAAVAIGSTVWKTDDPGTRRRLESSYRRDYPTRRIPLTVTARIEPDNWLRVLMRDNAGHEAEAVTPQPLQAAQRHPMTTALLHGQFARLGDTPFELAELVLLDAAGPTDSLPFLAPKSVLNDLRRRAVQAMLENRSAARRHRVEEPNALAILREERIAPSVWPRSENDLQLCVLVRTQEQMDAVLAWARKHPSIIAVIYCEGSRGPEAPHFHDTSARAEQPRPLIGLPTPVICKPGDEVALARIAQQRPNVILTRNLAALSWLRKHAPEIPLVGDYGLNVTNELSASALMGSGLTRLTPSCDLDETRRAQLIKASPGVPFEMIFYTHLPLFHTAHCLLAARLNGGNDCTPCAAPCRRHHLALRDRAGVEHPVLPDEQGRNTVFSGPVYPATGLLEDPTRSGARYGRIELLSESAPQTRELLDHCARGLIKQTGHGVRAP